MIRYIVAGTGRSGTGWASRILSALGGRCGHEAVFDFDRRRTLQRLASPSVDGDASLAAGAYLREPSLARVPVLHLVRHPADVVSSWAPFFVDRSTPYARFAAATVPAVAEAPDNVTAAVAWVAGMSDLITLDTRGPYRLERLEHLTADPELLADVVRWLGVAPVGGSDLAELLAKVGKVNQHPAPPVDLEPHRAVLRHLGTLYGYP